jgi:Rieske 2Fe-2S family protein
MVRSHRLQTIETVRDRPAWIDDLIARKKPMHSLDQLFYTSAEIFDVELERIFRRSWMYAGHVSQIRRPGEYFTYRLGDDSIVVIRGKDGTVRAFHNLCRHRGSMICLDDCGSVKKLVCPYHNWTYDLDGRLIDAKLMPEGFEPSDHGLHPVGVEILEGFIFLAVGDDPVDFRPATVPFHEHLAPYRLADAKIAHTREWIIEANWKLMSENFAECYHCAANHPEYCALIVGGAVVHNPRLAMENERLIEDAQARWRKQGLKIEPFRTPEDERWYATTRDPFFEGIVTQSRDGKPMAPLLGDLRDPDAGVFGALMYPSLWMEACSDYAAPLRLTPISPSRTHVRMDWLVRGDAVEGRDYQLEELTWFFTTTIEQDWKIIADNQRGMLSSRYRPGPYSEAERDSEYFDNWYLKAIR